jgi:hypothetical protein
MNSKKTIQDVKLGRIFRCSICDAKCDDTWGTKEGTTVCGRFVEKKDTRIMQCSKDCCYKYMRDKTRQNYEERIQVYEERLPRRIEGLKFALEEGYDYTSIMFKMVKHHKMSVKLLTRFISRQMTLAEIQAEFYTVSRLAMDIAEEWLEIFPDETETYMFWVDISAEVTQLVEGHHQARAWSVDFC